MPEESVGARLDGTDQYARFTWKPRWNNTHGQCAGLVGGGNEYTLFTCMGSVQCTPADAPFIATQLRAAASLMDSVVADSVYLQTEKE
jgi:hypothetical protein